MKTTRRTARTSRLMFRRRIACVNDESSVGRRSGHSVLGMLGPLTYSSSRKGFAQKQMHRPSAVFLLLLILNKSILCIPTMLHSLS